ncbi:fibronectin type III domain-containing protein [Aridibaculum aurantiacum]|uniref:fibronectin type III domain-containing protein n=1 Tax=Aridibaculum aurantiacum TaxID=2810307 RepID=UPI001A97963B|nr:fibronectin type III domain-containing protein [Aridibaculum aurantiacum]
MQQKFTSPFKAVLCILFILWEIDGWGQLLEQDFKSSSTINHYVSSTPTNGQFNGLTTSGASTTVTITSNKLRFSRSGGNVGAMSRTTDFIPNPTAMLVKFDVAITGNSAATTNFAGFQVGSGFSTNNSRENNANSHSRLGINCTSTDGQFTLRNIGTSVTGLNTFSGSQTITWAINNSGGTLHYRAPDGTNESIANDTWDVWVGTTKEFNDQPATTSTVDLTDFKFVIDNGTVTIDIDNILFDPLPITPTASTATALTSSSFNANWSAVSEVTGYRLDVATDNTFSTMVSGYDNLYVPGQSTNSKSVTGLSAGTSYYYRIRAASQYSVGEFASGNSSVQATSTLIGSHSLTAGTLAAFGSVCINNIEGPHSFTLSGSGLDGSDVLIGGLAGFSYSTTSSGTYTSTLTLPAYNGANITIYVKFNPTVIQSYDGDILVSGGGSSSINVAASGSGINLPPSVNTGGTSNITSTSVTLAGTIASAGCSSTTAYGIEYSTTNGFANGSGTSVSSSNLSSGSFTSSISGLAANTTYYFKAFATNSGGTSYGNQESFTTSNLSAPVIAAATSVSHSSFTANWNPVTGATGYQLDLLQPTMGNILTEGFEGINFPPQGWQATGWSRSTAASDTKSGSAAAIANSNNGSLTTASIAYPSSISFYLGRTVNTTSKTLTVEVSTSSPTTGFSTIETFDHNNVPAGSYDQYTIDLSSYSGNPEVYIRFTKSSTTTSQWRLDDISVSGQTLSPIPGFSNLLFASTSNVINGLTPNTTYYYRVRAASANSTSGNSNVISVTTHKDPATTVYRTKANGNLSSLSTWQFNQQGSDFIDATSAPSATNSILIQDGHQLLVDVDHVVAAGASLNIASTGSMVVSAGKSLTIAGTADFNNRPVVFKSNASGTARLGEVTGTLADATNVTVERYISGIGKFGNPTALNRAYRMLAPSVNTVTSINANWQEGQTNASTSSNSNLLPGYGTHITGAGGAANGFDPTLTNNASLFYYNAATDTWVTGTNTNVATLDAKKGYLLFVRGDRSINMLSTANPLPATNTVLRATGSLLTGTQVFSSLEGNGAFNLISNPYASPIDWASLAAANPSFEDFYTLWDPNQGTRGGYVTVDKMGVVSAGAATRQIQSGQAFFVKATSGAVSPTFTVTEADKSSENNIDVFRTGSMEMFRTSLYFIDASGRILADGVVNVYDNAYTKAVDANDAPQIANWDEDIAISRSNQMLSIEKRPLIDNNDTIFLSVARLKQQAYELQFEAIGFNAPGLQAYLEDKFQGINIPLSLDGPTVVPFTVTSNAASSAADRFRVVFQTAAVLPVTITAVKAYQQNNNIQVDWSVAGETDMAQYEVEKSADGRSFTKAVSVAARNTTSIGSYGWVDANPLNGANYYRIRSISRNGQKTLSQTVKVVVGKTTSTIAIFPNPVAGDQLSLQVQLPKGSYTISLINSVGQRVLNQTFLHGGGAAAQTLQLMQVPKGLYQLQVTGEGQVFTQSLLKK